MRSQHIASRGTQLVDLLGYRPEDLVDPHRDCHKDISERLGLMDQRIDSLTVRRLTAGHLRERSSRFGKRVVKVLLDYVLSVHRATVSAAKRRGKGPAAADAGSGPEAGAREGLSSADPVIWRVGAVDADIARVNAALTQSVLLRLHSRGSVGWCLPGWGRFAALCALTVVSMVAFLLATRPPVIAWPVPFLTVAAVLVYAQEQRRRADRAEAALADRAHRAPSGVAA